MRLSRLTLRSRGTRSGVRGAKPQAVAEASWTTGFNHDCFAGSLPEPPKGREAVPACSLVSTLHPPPPSFSRNTDVTVTRAEHSRVRRPVRHSGRGGVS